MLGSNLGDCCFWIVKFKWWIGQEPWSKGLTHMTRFDRVARTSCEDHLPYLGEGVIKVFHECSFLPTNFPVPAPKGQDVNYECVTLHLCNSQRVLIKIAIHNIALKPQPHKSCIDKGRTRCTASLCTAQSIYFQPLNLPRYLLVIC